jgi:hypothetical protein
LYTNGSVLVGNASIVVLIVVTVWLYTLLASSEAIAVALSSLISLYKVQYAIA